MGELDTYSLIHFIPFSLDTYVRLFARWNDTLWPVQIPAFLASLLAAAALATSSWYRVGGLFLAAGNLGAAAFFGAYYSELVWAGPWICVLLALQALALGSWLWFAPLEWSKSACAWIAALITFAAIYPALSGLGWGNAEVFGLTPDATCAGTLVMIASSKSQWRWPLMAIPLAWLGVSAATWWTLGDPGGLVIPMAGVTVAFGYSLRRTFW